MKTDPKTQEVWIEAVKSCGQSLIDNAEEIAGGLRIRDGRNYHNFFKTTRDS